MLPAGVRPRQLSVRTLLAGMCLAQADHRPAHLTRVHQALTSLPEDDQRRLGVIADWKHGPHLLTYRQTERTFGLVADALGKDEPDGLPSPALQARLRRPARGHPSRSQFKDASTVAGGGLDGPGLLLPAPAARHQRLRRPRSVLGPPQEQPAAQPGRAVLRLLPVRRDHDARGERARRPRARPPRHGLVVPARPGPRVRPRADRDARRRDPARRHPRRLRLRPPRRRRLGTAAARRRRRSSSRTCTRTTAAPRAPTTAPSSPTATSTARARPARCWSSGRSPAPPPKNRPRTTTARPPSSPATSSAASPPTTHDGYHRVACPAAMGKIRCPLRPASMTPGPGPARDPPAPRSTPRPAAPSRPSPSRRTCTPRPRRNTTTPPRPGAAPTPAAPAPNAASPPPRTPPPTTSAAAGAA